MRLSVALFCIINSVVPAISPVISVNSLKSKLSVALPLVAPPDKPVPATTAVMSPLLDSDPSPELSIVKPVPVISIVLEAAAGFTELAPAVLSPAVQATTPQK